MPPSGGMGGGVANNNTQYNTYQEYEDSQDMATGYSAGAYGEGGYDAAFDEEYPAQKPYPHPGIHGLQYGGDGRQYAAGGLPAGGQWGYEDEYGGYGDEDVEDLNTRMAAMTAEQRKAAIEAAQRSQSSKRYQEMERERKRRQLKTQGGTEKTSFFQATKLALMNSGLIPLKKGNQGKFLTFPFFISCGLVWFYHNKVVYFPNWEFFITLETSETIQMLLCFV